MAKDGTARGGQRPGSGRKSKALTEKVVAGNPGGRKLKVMEMPTGANLDGADVPNPKDYLSAVQKNGDVLIADEVFKETWLWLKEKGMRETCEQSSARTVRYVFGEMAAV